MIAKCPNCALVANVDDAALTTTVKLRCSRCRRAFALSPDGSIDPLEEELYRSLNTNRTFGKPFSPPKTSTLSPLRVQFVAALGPGIPGRLGMTMAPGKKADGIDGRWERDLKIDLADLRNLYAVDVLVSLIETRELLTLGIPALAEVANAAGIEVRRFPIPDGGVPEDEGAFVAHVGTTMASLREGKVVVVHCRGGLGRTGLYAATCLRTLGETGDRAIARVRAAREGTIETREQEEFVRCVRIG